MGLAQRSGRFATAGVLVLVAAGCSIGDVRRPAPPRPPAATASPPPTRPSRVGPDEVRRVRVPVPADYGQQQVEFTDARHGYVLFTRCGQASAKDASPAPGCPAILLSTSDGGRSWQRVRHPRPVAQNHQMYVGAGRLLLLAEPHGWYSSVDGGRTFTRQPASPQARALYHTLFGRFQVSEESAKVVEWVGGRARPIPVQPPVPGLDTVAYAQGRLLAAGVHDGRPYVALSLDEGRSWRATSLSAPDGDLAMVRLHMSVDGEAWLVGHRQDRMAFPHLWRNVGDRWETVAAAGHPEKFLSVAAIGFGMLVVTGPDASGVVTAEHYNDLGWPVRGGDLRVLDGGTLFGIDHVDGSIWLGPGWAGQRKWIKVVLERV